MNAQIIDRYLCQSIGRPFLISLCLLVLIFIGYSTAMQLADAAAGIVPTGTAIQLILLNTLIILEVLLPTALYGGIVAGFRQLYQGNEIDVLRAAGVSEFRLMGSVTKLVIPVALLVGLLSLFVRPWAYQMSYALKTSAAQNFSFRQVEARRFSGLAPGGHVLFAREVDKASGELYEVFLQRRDSADRSTVLVAARAQLPTNGDSTVNHDRRAVTFSDGYLYQLDRTGSKYLSQRFQDTLTLFLPETGPEKRYRRKAVSTWELAQSSHHRDIAEVQGRLSSPLLTLLLGLLAVQFKPSANRQQGRGSLAAAIVTYFLVLSSLGISRNLLEEDRIGAFPGMWAGFLLPVGMFLWFQFRPIRST